MAERTAQTRVRLFDKEKALMELRAQRCGTDVATLIRRRVLSDDFPRSFADREAWLGGEPTRRYGSSVARGAVPESLEEEDTVLSSVNAALTPTGEVIKAEVQEATLEDPAAREAYVERRAKQLVGQGSTSIVARRLAEAEWRNRGR